MVFDRRFMAICVIVTLIFAGGCNGTRVKHIPPTVFLSWRVSTEDQNVLIFNAQVTGGEPRKTDPPYGIGWDFFYDGIVFDTMASGKEVSIRFSDAGEYTVACMVTDSYNHELNPLGKPVIKTIKVNFEPVAVVGNDLYVEISWGADNDDPMVVHCTADVTGGIPMPGDTPYKIGWDFDYDGENFDTEAAGTNVSRRYDAPGIYLIGCQVQDARPQYSITETKYITISEKLPDPPSVILKWVPHSNKSSTVSLSAIVNGGLPMSGFPKYEIGWDFNYDGKNFDVEAQGESVLIFYPVPGPYHVACRVRDAVPDIQDPERRPIIVESDVFAHFIPPLDPPYSVISAWKVPGYKRMFSFHAEISGGLPYDTDPMYIVNWDFNYDGTFESMASGADVAYEFPTSGNFMVAVKVYDQIIPSRDPRRDELKFYPLTVSE